MLVQDMLTVLGIDTRWYSLSSHLIYFFISYSISYSYVVYKELKMKSVINMPLKTLKSRSERVLDVMSIFVVIYFISLLFLFLLVLMTPDAMEQLISIKAPLK